MVRASSYDRNRSKYEARSKLGNEWHTPFTWSFCASPGYFFYTLLCPQCAAYQQRSRMLRGDMSRYICCGGFTPCSGAMHEQSCPRLCMALEAYFCFTMSVVATRGMIQDEQQVRNSSCDNFILAFAWFLGYLSCMCDLVACLVAVDAVSDLSFALDYASDLCWCMVCSCVLTQQHVQINKRDGVLDAPCIQTMTRMQ